MAENLTIARPYAQAAFSAAIESSKIEKWQSMLYAMSLACENEFFMDSLKLAPNSNAASDILISLLKDVLDEEGINFVRILGENNRFEVISEIYAEFVRLKEKHEKCIEAELVSARVLSESEIDLLKDKLAKKYGSKVNLNVKIDKALIGGAVLKVGDKVIDASIKTSLSNLSSTLR
ncbi:MAG: F0F1 ATP synthase subunit delta [Succinivibrio sp.]